MSTKHEAAVADDQLDEVLERFSSMLSNVDFSAQLQTLGIGRFKFARRNEAREELRAMYVGLWKLALNRSFPVNAAELFNNFLKFEEVKGQRKQRKLEEFAERCREYSKILEVQGDTNFISVALLLCQHMGISEQDVLRRISLQLALDMRAMYHHIFERLI